MNYYIIYNGQQVGPMPKEELVKYGLTPNSKVWCEGMSNWADAATVADLHSILYVTPQQPPIPQPSYQGGYQQPGGYQQSYNAPMSEISFGDAIKICFSKYADFEGRARRSEYWWFYLFGVLVSWIPYLGWLASLAILIPSLAVGARRLHDTGRSGWWQLLLFTCVGWIFLIIWWCEDSQGDNEYGPSPKYPGT